MSSWHHHPALWREWKSPGQRETKSCEHLIFVRNCCRLFSYINCDQKLGSLLWPWTNRDRNDKNWVRGWGVWSWVRLNMKQEPRNEPWNNKKAFGTVGTWKSQMGCDWYLESRGKGAHELNFESSVMESVSLGGWRSRNGELGVCVLRYSDAFII